MNAPVVPSYRNTSSVFLLVTYRFPSEPNTILIGKFNPPLPEETKSSMNSPEPVANPTGFIPTIDEINKTIAISKT